MITKVAVETNGKIYVTEFQTGLWIESKGQREFIIDMIRKGINRTIRDNTDAELCEALKEVQK